jgi:hypothetical protein
MSSEQVFRCVSCGNETVHTVIARHTLSRYDAERGWESIPVDLLLSRCRTCYEEGLYSQVDEDAPVSLWPKNLDLGDSVPSEVSTLYAEANAVRGSSPNAYAVLIRKALEAICLQQNATGKNLADSLGELAKRLGFPATVELVAKATRLIGNMGAHYGKSAVSSAQVEAVDEFFLGIVEYVYIAPARLARYSELLSKLPAEAGGWGSKP